MSAELYDYLSATCGVAFLLLPPFLLFYRYRNNRPHWFLISIGIPLAGWAFWLGAATFHFQSLDVLMASQSNPSQELMDNWASDGGPMVIATFLGWLIAGVYALPWLLIYAFLSKIRSVRKIGVP